MPELQVISGTTGGPVSRRPIVVLTGKAKRLPNRGRLYSVWQFNSDGTWSRRRGVTASWGFLAYANALGRAVEYDSVTCVGLVISDVMTKKIDYQLFSGKLSTGISVNAAKKVMRENV